jgi:hypothetical protein
LYSYKVDIERKKNKEKDIREEKVRRKGKENITYEMKEGRKM